MVKICRGCYEYKIMDDFTFDKHSLDGRCSRCKICRNLKNNSLIIINQINREEFENNKKKKIKYTPHTLFQSIKNKKLKYNDLTPDEKFACVIHRINYLELGLFTERKDVIIGCPSIIKEIIDKIYKKEIIKKIRGKSNDTYSFLFDYFDDNKNIEIKITTNEKDFNREIYEKIIGEKYENKSKYINLYLDVIEKLVDFKKKYKIQKKTTIINLVVLNYLIDHPYMIEGGYNN